MKLNHIWNILVNRLILKYNTSFILIAYIIFFIISCKSNNLIKESPLACVIKLHSAEESLSFEIAKKYIDIEKVYEALVTKNKTAEDIWKEYIRFNYSIGKSKKFTNKFLYHKFNIFEIIKKNEGIEKFISTNGKKSIIYSLEIINGKYKIVKIFYNNKS